MTKVVVYDRFEKCGDYIADEFWKIVFFDCACGKFPRRMRYDASTNTIYVNVSTTSGRSKNEVFSLPSSTEELCKMMLTLFRDKLGMFSENDIHIKNEEMAELRKKNEIDMDKEWKNLKPKSYLQNVLILDFVINSMKNYTLTIDEGRDLLRTIRLGLKFKTISSDDVDYQDRKVQGIRGLSFDEKSRSWVITNESQIKYTQEKQKPGRIDSYITRFIKYHRKRILHLES